MPFTLADSRVRVLRDQPLRPAASYVLYWMIAARRTRHNFGLQHAADYAQTLALPLLVLEALRVDYPWASDRFHAFVIDGMRDNAEALRSHGAGYYPYVEAQPGAGKGLLAILSQEAALVVSDDAPTFFVPRMLDKAAQELACRFEVVDSIGLYPVRASTRMFTSAASFRRHLQKELPAHLVDMPDADPLATRHLPPMPDLPESVRSHWPPIDLGTSDALLCSLPIDHSIAATKLRGGPRAAERALSDFIEHKLVDYTSLRNQPSADCQSHLSPYLHFGHIASSEIFMALVAREQWTPGHMAERASGSRRGWWGMSEESEAFVDQLLTWRELGFNAAAHDPLYTRYQSLPTWAQASLAAHANDPRPYVYSEQELLDARTHDPIWNAAQRQLVREGTIHNYLRMLWGKKILEWSPRPERALELMIDLNNRYALDGRDPNSYSGIFWVLGRYDRAWGPERAIYGKIRYMSSDNTARKLRLGDYLKRYAEA